MADPNDEQAQEQSLELRIALNNAYAFVEGAKAVQSAASVTYEELLDQQLERIAGAGTSSRPNALNRIDKVLSDVQQAVAKIKSLPDDAFRDHNPETDVNTTI